MTDIERLARRIGALERAVTELSRTVASFASRQIAVEALMDAGNEEGRRDLLGGRRIPRRRVPRGRDHLRPV